MKYLILFVPFLILLSCKSPTEVQETSTYDVKYEVIGTAEKVNLTFENDASQESTTFNTRLPWIYTFSKKKPTGTTVYLKVENNQYDGMITAKIWRDKAVFKQDTKSGTNLTIEIFGKL